ncbi:MAG: shikimate kinase [Verrucomicrobia bacterium]|nr:shikimate kinase [Verrucomicrobiota bacterium]
MFLGRNIQNLALTGFMGVGKSTMGRHLADFLHFQFMDTDEIIESRQKKAITDIFATQGESFFRALEKDLVLEMQGWESSVISTGGGLLAFGDNMQQLKKKAFVVCLWAAPETIYNRIKRQSNRPLLQTDDPLETIRSMLEKRKAAYRMADLMINTDTRPMRHISQIIVRQFRQAQHQSKKENHPASSENEFQK